MKTIHYIVIRNNQILLCVSSGMKDKRIRASDIIMAEGYNAKRIYGWYTEAMQEKSAVLRWAQTA